MELKNAQNLTYYGFSLHITLMWAYSVIQDGRHVHYFCQKNCILYPEREGIIYSITSLLVPDCPKHIIAVVKHVFLVRNHITSPNLSLYISKHYSCISSSNFCFFVV